MSIARHMAKASEDDFKNFDHFNDFKDTLFYLESMIAESKDSKEKNCIRKVIDRLKIDHQVAG